MAKIANVDDIKEKLDYIGLDLENIPDFLINYPNIEYKPLKAYEENEYRVYKHIPISKIKIFLTPTNRLNTINEKFSKISNLKAYLTPEKDEDIIKHSTFLNMLKTVQIEEIEKLIKMQDKFKKQVPFKVKYDENYLWQIYYSDIDDMYFMLVPTEDLQYGAFFYLLKKQIEYHNTKKEEMIYVPIVYENYSNEYLKTSEILDLQKYITYFTKSWCNIYELYDKKKKVTMQIVGETVVYENIKCLYKNKLEDKEEAVSFYKLLKAMFILATRDSKLL